MNISFRRSSGKEDPDASTGRPRLPPAANTWSRGTRTGATSTTGRSGTGRSVYGLPRLLFSLSVGVRFPVLPGTPDGKILHRGGGPEYLLVCHGNAPAQFRREREDHVVPVGSPTGIPTSFETLLYASQLLQAEAIRYGVEHFRRNRNDDRCMGAIYWQLNDNWPVASWASIDYFGRWKALHYYAARFFAPVMLLAVRRRASSQGRPA